MEHETTISEQIRTALDGRTLRWLSFEIRMPETQLSKKMNFHENFSQEDIDKINARLSSKIKLPAKIKSKK